MKATNMSIADVTPQDLARAIATAKQVVRMGEELEGIFPERGDLIRQFCFALLCREHLLVHGVHGTGKSDLAATAFSMITGSQMFSVNLTKFMSEGSVIGIPNTKKMREEGIIEHELDGTIVRADFAELDEIFDASAPLLRVLLSILNERMFKRGRQCEEANLHTAIASTNGDPEKVVTNSPELAAVIDRFLFQSRVDYLQEEQSRLRMYEKFLTGAKPATTISLEDLKHASDIVVCANQITDPYFIEVYDRVVQELREAFPERIISDRRACKMLSLCEANALMYGRGEICLEDIYAIEWAVCYGGVPDEHEIFHQTVTPLIEEATAQRPVDMDQLQCSLLDEYEGNVPDILAATDDQLIGLVREVKELRKKTEQIEPQLQSTTTRRDALLHQLDELRTELMSRIEGEDV